MIRDFKNFTFVAFELPFDNKRQLSTKINTTVVDNKHVEPK